MFKSKARRPNISQLMGKVEFTGAATAPTPIRIQIGILGDAGCGKTSLIQRWLGRDTGDLLEQLAKEKEGSSGSAADVDAGTPEEQLRAVPVVPKITASTVDDDLSCFDDFALDATSPEARASVVLSLSSQTGSGVSDDLSLSHADDGTPPLAVSAGGSTYEIGLEETKGSTWLRNDDATVEAVFFDGSRWCRNFQKFGAKHNPFEELDGLVVAYDLTESSRESYNNVDKIWKVQLDQHNKQPSRPVLVLGLKDDGQKALDPTLIRMIKPWIEFDAVCSAISGKGCEDALRILVDEIVTRKLVERLKEKRAAAGSRGDVGDHPHMFKKVYFKKPTWCMFCKDFIWGVTSKQGMECARCGYQCHKRCHEQVPHFCGIHALPERQTEDQSP